MATRQAVLATLTMLAREYAGTVTEEKADLWLAALEDVSDVALAAAVATVIKTHTGGFIPPVAVIREAAGANALPAIDAGRLLREIDRLGEHNPATGWQSPSVEVVRQIKGDAVADAYAAAGGPERLFEGGATTREIAAREFAQEMAAQVKAHGGAALLPPAVPAVPQLAAGDAQPKIEAPAVQFNWRAVLKGAFALPKPDLAKIEAAAAAGDALAAKYLARKRTAA